MNAFATILLLALLALSSQAHATTLIYTDRGAFEAALNDVIIDDYSAPGYVDVPEPFLDNQAMNAVLGETDYEPTANLGTNVFGSTFPREFYYCAGCNGSFRLLFGTTSVTKNGTVFGVGFNYFNQVITSGSTPFVITVTFGDGSVVDYPLLSTPNLPFFDTFFGITSELGIANVHLGLPGGEPSRDSSIAIDNLTIGDANICAAATPTTGCTVNGVPGQLCAVTSGTNTITGSDEADVILGGSGIDTINGGNGDDLICGGGDNDTLSGGNGDDQLYGQSGDDVLDGNNGNDRLDGGSGADQANGGRGIDFCSAETLTDCDISQ